VVQPLEGFTVGITADRRWAEQAELLRRHGLTVVHAPCIRTLPLGAEDGVRAATDAVIARPPDFLVANTAIGVRGWLASAAGWGLETDLVDALVGARILARGPKAAGTLRAAGLDVWWQAPTEQLADVRDHLLRQPLGDRRVAVLYHGDDNDQISPAVRGAGGTAVGIPVYRWTPPQDREPALRLISDVCARRVDAVTFTAAPALRNFFTLADELGARDAVRDAMNDEVIAACIGPVCAAAAHDAGIRSPAVPDRWRLGALVHTLARHLESKRRRFRMAGTEVVRQGAVAVVDDVAIWLSDRERALIDMLAQRPGATVPKSALLRGVWGSAGTDEHVLSVTVARLRSKLGPAGPGIKTVVRRGYRMATDQR